VRVRLIQHVRPPGTGERPKLGTSASPIANRRTTSTSGVDQHQHDEGQLGVTAPVTTSGSTGAGFGGRCSARTADERVRGAPVADTAAATV
jgi:hypothetical protein